MKRASFCTAIALILIPRTAPAPLFGGFESLDALIDHAGFIVVAEIVKRPPIEEIDFGGGGIYGIHIFKVLKGKVAENKKATAYLRDLPFIPFRHPSVSLTLGLLEGQIYLLFLNKPAAHSDDESGNPPEVDFENENSSGDAIYLGTGWSSDLADSLKDKNIRQSIVALLQNATRQQRAFVEAIDGVIDQHTSENFSQPVVNILWIADGKVAEAAKFYSMILKHGGCPIDKLPYHDFVPGIGQVSGIKLCLADEEIALCNASKKEPNSTSFVKLNCNTQEEIDEYWENLSAGGEKLKGGWIKDKFGVFWHVIPSDLTINLSDVPGQDAHGDPLPNNSGKVLKAMMEMDKLDAAALRRAEHGD